MDHSIKQFWVVGRSTLVFLYAHAASAANASLLKARAALARCWCHSIINPLADAHSPLIARAAQLYQPIAEQMAFHGYDSWHISAIEHIINAVTTRLVTQVFGEHAGAEALDDLLQDDYRYLPPLLDCLMEYEAQRERYPTLSSFFPHLVDALPHDASGKTSG